MRIPILAVSLVVLTSALLVLTIDEAVAGGSTVEGTVYVRNYMGDYRAAGWVTVTATNGVTTVTARTPADGRYRFPLATGNWEITANLQGYKTVTETLAMPDGGHITHDFYLEQSGVPIPEFHEYATPLITSMSLLLVVILMRRRTILSARLT